MASSSLVPRKPTLAEDVRQVLNQSIDLLHKLSSEKISKEIALEELRKVQKSSYERQLKALGDQADGLTQAYDSAFESFMAHVSEIVDGLDAGTSPLYESIMLMNKAVVNAQIFNDAQVEEYADQPKKVFEEKKAPAPTAFVLRDEAIEEEFDPTHEAKEKEIEAYWKAQFESQKAKLVDEPDPVEVESVPIFKSSELPSEPAPPDLTSEPAPASLPRPDLDVEKAQVSTIEEEEPVKKDERGIEELNQVQAEESPVGVTEKFAEMMDLQKLLKAKMESLNEELAGIGFEIKMLSESKR
ncbi:MAG: hypothetical protein S4CHLAM102_13790 [Chlamydiia bacterium]|nr:hypothetical protein [Chlamydiia bacterium]